MNANLFDSKSYITLHRISKQQWQAIRYYCLGYDQLCAEYEKLHEVASGSIIRLPTANRAYFSGVENAAIESAMLKDEIDIIPTAAQIVDPHIANFIILWATKDIPYNTLHDVYGLTCTPVYFERCARMFICQVDKLLRKNNIKISLAAK